MLTSDGIGRGTTRRGVLRAGGVALGSMLLGATASPAAAQSGGNLDNWFDGVDNYDGVVDRTGQAEVTVAVGVQNGDGPFGFGPAAVRVSPGTTVTWEWTGKGGSHNVIATDGSYESELVAEAGHTFSHTFETAGVSKYFCEPHRALGMKGAIVIGDARSGSDSQGSAGGETGGGQTGGQLPMPSNFAGWAALVFGGTLFLANSALLGAEGYAEVRERRRAEARHAGDYATEAPADDPAVEVDEGFDPVGTAALVAGYFLLVTLLWVFMYFVEYLSGVTIIG